MSDRSAVAKAIEQAREQLPDFVVDLRWDVGPDSTGEPSAFVTLVLKDKAFEQPGAFDRREKVADQIRDSVRAARPELFWTYVTFQAESEQNELLNDDDEEPSSPARAE